MQPGLLIIILARKPHINRDQAPISVRIFLRRCPSESVALPAPHDRAVRIRGRPRGGQVVGVQIVHAAIGFNLGNQRLIQPHIVTNRCAVTVKRGGPR